jgi:hypothetical protein
MWLCLGIDTSTLLGKQAGDAFPIHSLIATAHIYLDISPILNDTYSQHQSLPETSLYTACIPISQRNIISPKSTDNFDTLYNNRPLVR